MLADVCLLLNANCCDKCDGKPPPAVDLEYHSLEEMITTFWQHEEGDGRQNCDENIENNEKLSDNDSCFSNDEMDLIREIFLSQHLNLSSPGKKACEENSCSTLISETDCNKTISLSINKTIDKPTAVDSQSDCKPVDLVSGILGDSPNVQFKIPQKQSVRDSKTAETYEWATSRLPLANALEKNSSKTESHSSLEAIPSNSSKNLSSISTRTQSFSGSHFSSGEDAFADTLPVESGDSSCGKIESVQRKSSSTQGLSDSERISWKTHLHNAMMLDLTKVGDHPNIVNGQIPNRRYDFYKVHGEKRTPDEESVRLEEGVDIMVERNSGNVQIDKNNSPRDLFHKTDVCDVAKQQGREALSKEVTAMIYKKRTRCVTRHLAVRQRKLAAIIN